MADIMATPLPCVPGTMPFKELALLFLSGEIPALVVVGERCEPVGIVTEADLLSLQAFAGLAAGDMALRWENDDTLARIATRHLGLNAQTLMSTPVVMISASADETEAARMFVTTGFKVLPVVEKGVLVGSLERRALLRRFDHSDEDTLSAVQDVLTEEPRSHDIAAEVAEGVVSLAGSAESPRSAYEVERAVASVEGVVNVLWRTPTAGPDPSGGGDDPQESPPRSTGKIPRPAGRGREGRTT